MQQSEATLPLGDCYAGVRAAATAYIDAITLRRHGIKPLRGEELALKSAFCAGAEWQQHSMETSNGKA